MEVNIGLLWEEQAEARTVSCLVLLFSAWIRLYFYRECYDLFAECLKLSLLNNLICIVAFEFIVYPAKFNLIINYYLKKKNIFLIPYLKLLIICVISKTGFFRVVG